MKFFFPHEFACHDAARTPYPAELIETVLRPFIELTLDPLREAFGEPLHVVSGYRTPAHNHTINGAALSRHMVGDAADIAPSNPTIKKIDTLHGLALAMWKEKKLEHLGGLGRYPGKWIHVDNRPRKPSGGIARWLGAGIGSER